MMPAETVVITGASAGVGRATALAFARRGARIGLLARGVERLNAAAAEVRAAGGEALVLPTDVADPDAVESAAAAVERQFGPIDIWVNDAMATVFARFADITPDEFRRVTEVTYLGFVHGTMAALRRMRARDRGTIVQVGSTLAYRSIPLQSAYCGAKHAIVGFTDSIRSELIHEGSRVHLTVVHMPALNTPQFEWARNKMPRRPQPVPPIFQPEVAAEAIVYAAHSRRREMEVGGPTVEAILAQKIAPGLLDRYLASRAYAGQQTNEPADPRHRDNLFAAVPGAYAAHGRFDARARSRSAQLWLDLHRGWVAAAFGVLAGAAAGALLDRGAGRRLLASR